LAELREHRYLRLLLAALLTSALALSACGGDGGGEFDPGSPDGEELYAEPVAEVPALCRGDIGVKEVGNVVAPAATELSGLVRSRTQKDVMWTHNDSGDSPRLFAISPRGRLLAEIAVTGAQSRDWEDIAAGRGTLLIGDIGDNDTQRKSIVVYRIREPRIAGGTTVTKSSAKASRIELRYPDGAHDAEALLRDPESGAIVIVDKRGDGRSGVYVADAPKPGRSTTMRRVGRLFLGEGESVTAGDVSADGRTIALRSYHHAFAWRRAKGESVADALLRKSCQVQAEMMEGQTESLALTADGRAYYSVPEGEVPTLRRYAPLG